MIRELRSCGLAPRTQWPTSTSRSGQHTGAASKPRCAPRSCSSCPWWRRPVGRQALALLRLLDAACANAEELAKATSKHFGQHPDVEIYRSQPGLGVILGARVLAEFGDDPDRYADAKARKNYAGTSPITRQSGKMRLVRARYVHNDRLVDALNYQAFAALRVSPGARAYYDRQRARGVSHHAALRQLANRLVGILHGCLKTHTCYDEATAWLGQATSARQQAA